jgi:hypothetical protein
VEASDRVWLGDKGVETAGGELVGSEFISGPVSMCLQSYSWRTSLQRHRLERSMISYSPNSVLWIHHEFEGGVRCIYLYIVFPHFFRGFSCIFAHLYMYYICGLWPLWNTTCLFLTGSTQMCAAHYAFLGSSMIIASRLGSRRTSTCRWISI